MNERLCNYPDWSLPLDLNRWQRFLIRLNDTIAQHDLDTTIILTSPELRATLAKALNRTMTRITVLSIAEVPSHIAVQTVGSIGLNDAN
jgi:flagellar biosynthesis protein FlhA